MKKNPIKRSALSVVASSYPALLADIKQRIRTAQVRTVMAGNASMLLLYWEIGGVLAERQQEEGWGAGVLPKLEADLKNELPEEKGFSERNMRRMIQFYREYPRLLSIRTQAVSKLENHSPGAIRTQPVAELDKRLAGTKIGQRSVAQLPGSDCHELLQVTWAHNLVLMQKVKDLPTRLWYARQAFEHGWGRDMLSLQIQSRVHERQGKAVTNFPSTLPPLQSDLASQLLKDPYIFDFLTLEKPFHERELETGLLRHLQDFLVELGTGFAFVGRQVHMEVGDDDFYIDLLFYHLHLRCFIVIDLKVGKFKAEYAGKMNFYLNAVDDCMKHESDHPSIGLILCEDKNKIVAEYALRGMEKSIGVSAYELTRALPKKLQSALPSIEQLEAELSPTRSSKPAATAKKKPTKSPRRRKSE